MKYGVRAKQIMSLMVTPGVRRSGDWNEGVGAELIGLQI